MPSHRPGRITAGAIAAVLAIALAAPAASAGELELTTVAPDGHVADQTTVDSPAEAEHAVTDTVAPAAGRAGALRITGDNTDGELGLGSIGSETNFGVTADGTDWTAAATGGDFTCALRAPGTLWCWGENGLGQLGLGDRSQRTAPVQVGTDATWATITTGATHACATRTDGSLWCWGAGSYGKLGLGALGTETTPQRVPGSGWKAASAAIDSTCAVKTDGTLWCWGYNGSGQLGLGTVTSERTPQRVGTSAAWRDVTAGGYHTCATQRDDTLWCWGDNNLGEAGVGNVSKQRSPALVGAGWRTAAAQFDSTCAIRTDGTLWCWGYNGSGELGIGTTSSERTPRQVGTGADWAELGAGRYSACATKADSNLWCWGYNAVGQLGLGDTARRTAPVQVPTPAVAVGVAGGPAANHTAVLTSDTTPVDACPERPLGQYFAALGDLADYGLAPGGDFEGPVDAWSLKHATVVDGNETVGIVPGTRSLRIGGLGTTGVPEVVSPPFCINVAHPHFRFLATAPDGRNVLTTAIRFRPRFNPAYVVELSSATTAGEPGIWGATAIQPLATRIAEHLIAKGGTVQLVFRTSSTTNARGGVQVDNVLVDPYRRR